MYVEANRIVDFFELLNSHGLEYVLLRNIGEELPFRFAARKDIDLLVRSQCRSQFHQIISRDGWHSVDHPYRNSVFLYGMDKFDMFSDGTINIDVSYQLCCRSVNDGEWVPLDQMINESVWKNRRRNDRNNWFEMGPEDQLVHLVTRCIFDKGAFELGYTDSIEGLLSQIDLDALALRLRLVFFKFAPVLLQSLRTRDYSTIVERYFQFSEY